MSKKNMFPAPAGMSPYTPRGIRKGHNVPRTRGDEPDWDPRNEF